MYQLLKELSNITQWLFGSSPQSHLFRKILESHPLHSWLLTTSLIEAEVVPT